MDEILNLISGREYQINADWGLSMISQILMNRQLGADEEYFQKMFDKSMEIGVIYDGQYQGELNEMGGDHKSGSIAVMKMSGIMTQNDGWCNRGAKSIDRQFRQLYSDQKIKGILFDVDSGGGESTAGSTIYSVLKDRNKPVVTYASFLGSAALKGTLPSDEIIVVDTSTPVGSIGTMYTVSKKMLDKAVENEIDIYSTESNDKNNGWRALKLGDKSILEAKATAMDRQFMAKVKKERRLEGGSKMVKETLAGGTFLGIDAKSRGLVDGIGTFNYALKRLNSHIRNFKN